MSRPDHGQVWEPQQFPCDGIYIVYKHWNMIQPLKRRQSYHATPWMDLEDMMLSEISQSHTKKQIPCDSTYMRSVEQSKP